METKFTQTKKSNFYNFSITKLISSMLFVCNKNKLIINYNILFIIVLFFLPTITFGQSGDCNFTINVVKNRNVKSIPPEGIYYPMNITNNGSDESIFSLSALNINANCTNTDGSNTTSNVPLNSEFLDSNSNKISQIYLNPGESKSFMVRITIPSGTPIGKWNCTEIMASSKSCINYKTSAILHSFVMNPNGDN